MTKESDEQWPWHLHHKPAVSTRRQRCRNLRRVHCADERVEFGHEGDGASCNRRCLASRPRGGRHVCLDFHQASAAERSLRCALCCVRCRRKPAVLCLPARLSAAVLLPLLRPLPQPCHSVRPLRNNIRTRIAARRVQRVVNSGHFRDLALLYCVRLGAPHVLPAHWHHGLACARPVRRKQASADDASHCEQSKMSE